MTQHLHVRPEHVPILLGFFYVVLAIALGMIAQRFIFWSLARWVARHEGAFWNTVVRDLSKPAAYIVPLSFVLVVMPNLVLGLGSWKHPVFHTVGLCVIAAFGWAMIAVIRVWADYATVRHRLDVEDNLTARQLETRVSILARSAVTTVAILIIGLMLMTFPDIRTIGTTLLASAGFAGIVVGLAARPFFENLIAGIQLALTQPIRLDDVVIVEKQYGRIEEIHSTYVVIRLWDLRRMVVPLTYFINTPFENWTRRSANLLGSVIIYTDFTFDPEGLRAAMPAILAKTTLWDKQFWNIQVNDVTENAAQIRALVTAKDSSTLNDLQAYVREGMLAYVRDNQPDCFPGVRIAGDRRADGEADRAALVHAANGKHNSN